MAHQMNPFHFVPLPLDGPRALPQDVLDEPRYEGCIEYSIEVKTPLHITGKTTRNGNHFDQKYFYENYGRKVIPGSSIRGMLAAFIEAVTGSDLRIFNRGDEEASGRRLYGKHYDPTKPKNCRHVGFLLAAPDHPLPEKTQTTAYNHRGHYKTRQLHECHDTLPPSFGMDKVADAVRFLFGYVNAQSEENRPAAGRLFFEDVIVPDDQNLLVTIQAWDLKGDPIMGGPNPRANTAWYFTTNSKPRLRNVPNPKKPTEPNNVWEVLADKVRGRKFYFHQEPARCHQEYKTWEKWVLTKDKTETAMVEYKVDTIAAGTKIQNGKIYFVDMPKSLLSLVAWAITLDPDMAHKLGGLKPFGFGSVKLEITEIRFRAANDSFSLQKQNPGLGTACRKDLRFDPAYQSLKRVLHWPSAEEMSHYLFTYPYFNQTKNATPEQKGFAQVANDLKPPCPENSKKITMFFDHYQQTAQNYSVVFGGMAH
jgi:CRISPR/Cas system CSM-associated protein Csm3 (group 7 of RAMP superfamily)